jgi:adenosylcobinamide-GDP ribazoletransferase
VRFDPAGEARLLVMAVQFLTRLPVPAMLYRPDWLPRSAKYFPLVGALVGFIAVIVLGLGRHIWLAPLPEILAVASAILVTGALHEDGLADTADSLGGTTREKRLAIMKDSRIGTFGVLALVISFGLRVTALCTMPPLAGAAALIAAPAAGRLAAVLLMAAAPYAGDPAASRIQHAPDRPRRGELILASLFGLLPLALLYGNRASVALCVGAAASLVLAIAG